MVKKSLPQRASAAIAALQTALDIQDAAEKLVARRLARLATLLSTAEPLRRDQGRAPVLVVNNPPHRYVPLSDTAA